ncbi:hypothetical protein E2C01_042744 [Portunus trituberculatus]|uniref:Uncharacterized protein n=1 Tax=Portunus trituberculatus TaxID=210409 RepID=A0A5B7FVM3_PORTR|nr:hypothetical protein [Portunus trituberculatus]
MKRTVVVKRMTITLEVYSTKYHSQNPTNIYPRPQWTKLILVVTFPQPFEIGVMMRYCSTM